MTTVSVSDYGAVGDGVANDRQAFLDLRDDFQGASVIITSPVDKTYYIGPRSGDADDDYLFSGIATLVTQFNRSTLTDNGTANDFHLGCRHSFYQDNLHSAKIETVSALGRTVTLKTAADHSKFSVGGWVCVTGFMLQDFGFPINPHFFEFVKVASKQTSVLPYRVTFETPLKNSYKSTWPDWGGGSAFEQDINGPAAIYAMHPSWDCDHDYRALTVDKTGDAIKATNCGGRGIILRAVRPTNYAGINPSACKSHRLFDCNYTAVTLEVDKCIEEISFSHSRMGTVSFQSSSTNLLRVTDGCTFSGPIVGTPRRALISGSTTSNLYPGAAGYGASDQLILKNSVIGGGIQLGAWLYKGGNSSEGADIGVDNGLNTMTAGVIRIPKSYGAKSCSWAVPGGWFSWVDLDRTCTRLARVIDVTDDATYVYVHTSEDGSWPDYNTDGGSKLYIRPHPCPQIVVENCSESGVAGSDDGSFVYGLNEAPKGAPLYSYAKYTCTGTAQTQGGNYLWGNLESASIAVNSPYAGSTTPLKFDPFGSFCWTTHSDETLVDYVPSINARTTGTRTIALGVSYTIGNLKAGDTGVMPPEVPTWIANHVFGFMETDIAGGGAFALITVTAQTDQGIESSRVFECNFS